MSSDAVVGLTAIPHCVLGRNATVATQRINLDTDVEVTCQATLVQFLVVTRVLSRTLLRYTRRGDDDA